MDEQPILPTSTNPQEQLALTGLRYISIQVQSINVLKVMYLIPEFYRFKSNVG
jgi:hypothetical protein